MSTIKMGHHKLSEIWTVDLSRVNFEVTTPPFPYLAFPPSKGSTIASQLPSFDGELMASYIPDTTGVSGATTIGCANELTYTCCCDENVIVVCSEQIKTRQNKS
jgi:hypothetical protein